MDVRTTMMTEQSPEEQQAAIAWLLENAPANVRLYINNLLAENSHYSGLAAGRERFDVSTAPSVDG